MLFAAPANLSFDRQRRFWARAPRAERDYRLVVAVHAGGVHLPGNAVVAYLIAALLPA
jgi:hypothetical protein